MKPSPREIEVFTAYARYGGFKEAAPHLGIAEQTMKNHMRSLYRKLEVVSGIQAAWVLWGRKATEPPPHPPLPVFRGAVWR